jgi:hypothetical protein
VVRRSVVGRIFLLRRLAVAVVSWMVITVGAPALPGVTVGGLNVAVAPGGNPEAERVTMLLNAPPSGGTVRLTVTNPPGATMTGVAGPVTVKAVITVSVRDELVSVRKLLSPP